ncbi:ATP-binding cassette domain-containing protein [Actinomyces culturomici]|uniref:ATP-binding cassette domain-containing protein n=1 Tax=Actinomyces culturomici TaxID=1926276 RepID=UPI000E1FE2B5|nr:ABC transporter ATP-binding protein [Actinomyces culturomici]
MTTPRPQLDRVAGEVALLATGVEVLAEARRDRPERALVDGVDVEARVGRTLVIVGESGAGKSMLARALTGLLPTGVTASGAMRLGGASIDLARAHTQLDGLRGSGIVWLPQDPFTSLSPTHRCGDQILAHRSGAGARESRIADRLAEVGLEPRVRDAYPHELSGGMRQRVAIAAALDAEPAVLIADEPTTALDVTTQREVLDLLADLRDRHAMALVLITHDLALAREFGDDVFVMRAGRVVEVGPAAAVLSSPREEYTRALAAAEPRLDGPDPRAGVPSLPESARVIVEAVETTKIFGRGSEAHVALDCVSLAIREGESVGLVGESGSGKTTLARCLIGLETPTAGEIRLDDPRPSSAAPRGTGFLGRRRRPAPPIGIVFQNPYSALNPALSVGAALREALEIAGRSKDEVGALLEQVGLPSAYATRLPAALSGGERQRVAIARALATRPALLICDEAVSALDVSVQAQILALLSRLQREEGFALLFITHDLAVARAMSDRLVVMKDGRIVEEGPTAQVLERPRTEYARRLLAAVPGRTGEIR